MDDFILKNPCLKRYLIGFKIIKSMRISLADLGVFIRTCSSMLLGGPYHSGSMAHAVTVLDSSVCGCQFCA